MAHTPLILAQLDGDLTYDNSGAGGTGTGTGAVRYRDGHTGGVQGALVEEGTVNRVRNSSAENDTVLDDGWGFTGSATRSKSTDQASDGTNSAKAVTPASANSGLTVPMTGLTPATPGQAWTLSSDVYGNGTNQLKLTITSRNGSTAITHYDGSAVTPPASWTRYSTTQTVADGTTNQVTGYVRTVAATAMTFYADRAQLEQKDHATTYCPEWSTFNSVLRTGYSETSGSGDAGLHYYTRAAAKIEIPTAAPDWVAFRYRETETGAMGFDYIETLTGNNVGTYGKISHDGSDLVIESDRLLVIGPVYAGTGSLDAGEQTFLENAETWTFGMSLASDPPVVDAGADDTVQQNVEWTQSGSFTDADSSSWTATVDYDDGAGDEPLTLDGTTFDLAYTWATPGIYTVTVKVTDDGDQVGQDTVQVTVTEGLLPGIYFAATGVTGTDATAPVVTLT